VTPTIMTANRLQAEVNELRHKLEQAEKTLHERSPRDKKAEKVLKIVEKFIKKQRIRCAEDVGQSDRVIINAYDLIEDLCNVAGYHNEED
jgi:hypothetical protein